MNADIVIERIAATQYGLATRKQLLAAGVSRRAIDRRIAAGRLRVLHRGVFQVGPIAGARAPELAAVLACGAGAVLSHASAAALWELASSLCPGVEVSTGAALRRRPAGMVVHRQRLDAAEVTVHEGVPVTTVARTILDLAVTHDGAELERAIARGVRTGLLETAELIRLATSRPRHRGSARVLALLRAEPDPALTRSEAEARLLDLVRRARLPRPRVNAPLHGFEVDFLWSAERLVVEVDGYAYHASAHAFERDRRRDARLTAAGLRVIRVTWNDVVRHPEATLVIIAGALVRG